MAQEFVATAIAPGNHDWDFQLDEVTGDIMALFVKGSVEYNDGDMVRGERFDVWPGMTQAQKDKVQAAYTAAAKAFDNHFLG